MAPVLRQEGRSALRHAGLYDQTMPSPPALRAMNGDTLVLVVEDDPVLSDLLVEQLAVDGEFSANAVGSATEALARLRGSPPYYDALLLDIGLPDADGCALCQSLREIGLRQPIIMLTGSDAEADVVRALDAGANDYIAKPFRLAELLARLRAQLRSFESSGDAWLSIGPYQFHPASRALVHPGDGRQIKLTEKEAAILKCLHRAGTRPVSRQALLDTVWGFQTGVSTHTLETHIYRLRRKMEPNPNQTTLLITEGGGYRLESTPVRSGGKD